LFDLHLSNNDKEDLLGTYFGIGYVPNDSACTSSTSAYSKRSNLINDDNPHRFIGIYLTFQSVINKLSVDESFKLSTNSFSSYILNSDTYKYFLADPSPKIIVHYDYQLFLSLSSCNIYRKPFHF